MLTIHPDIGLHQSPQPRLDSSPMPFCHCATLTAITYQPDLLPMLRCLDCPRVYVAVPLDDWRAFMRQAYIDHVQQTHHAHETVRQFWTTAAEPRAKLS